MKWYGLVGRSKVFLWLYLLNPMKQKQLNSNYILTVLVKESRRVITIKATIVVRWIKTDEIHDLRHRFLDKRFNIKILMFLQASGFTMDIICYSWMTCTGTSILFLAKLDDRWSTEIEGILINPCHESLNWRFVVLKSNSIKSVLNF